MNAPRGPSSEDSPSLSPESGTPLQNEPPTKFSETGGELVLGLHTSEVTYGSKLFLWLLMGALTRRA
eukprot:8222254-Alexandrium_andersonii.AAC.1